MSLKHRKLGRTSDQRRAMLRAMVTYLLENGQIKTTITRAKDCLLYTSAQALLEKGILSKCQYGVKILGNGNLTKKLHVQASAFSASAKEKIVAAGGKYEVI